MRELTFEVTQPENGLTALDLLKGRGFSRRIVTKLKQSGGLTRGGTVLRSVDRVFFGETVRVRLPEDSAAVEPNPDVKAAAVYEDEDVVVFDKPPYLPTHPSIGHYTDTLANLFAAMYPGIAFRPLNRLDRNTSGLCVCAKNRLAASALRGKVSKVYYAAVDGRISEAGSVSAPIGRVSDSIIKRAVRPDGQPAKTLYKPVLWENGRTLLAVTLLTGRTHQIRVHMAHIGFPLCGDEMYGGSCSDIARQALHCGEVEFTNPVTGELVSLKSKIPEDISRLFEKM